MNTIRPQVAALALLLLISNRVVGQTPSVNVYQAIDSWTEKSGIVVTSKVREQVAHRLAEEFVGRLQGLKGMDSVRSSRLVETMQNGGSVEYDADANKLIGRSPRGSSPDVEVYVESYGSGGAGTCNTSYPPQCTGGVSVMSQSDIVERAYSLLVRYPNIHIVVQPVPPIDYVVQIDGKIFRTTEQGLYGVPPGVVVAVRVQRPGRPPCNWSGRVMGQEQVVMCML
jgi:hypothetical protein